MQIILIDETHKAANGLIEKLKNSKNGSILPLTSEEMDLYSSPNFFRILTIDTDDPKCGEQEMVEIKLTKEIKTVD